jgi:hypothetical protein
LQKATQRPKLEEKEAVLLILAFSLTSTKSSSSERFEAASSHQAAYGEATPSEVSKIFTARVRNVGLWSLQFGVELRIVREEEKQYTVADT